MIRANNPKGPESVKVEFWISKQAKEEIERLLATGFYGLCLEQTMERLMCQAILEHRRTSDSRWTK